jgi:putative ABC transport system permease protein
MFGHYFATALRNLAKRKLFTFINIAGLSLGIATFLILVRYVEYEFSYDTYLPNAGQIYRVNYQESQAHEQVIASAKTHSGILPLLRHDVPEVQKATRALPENCLIFNEQVKIFQKGFWVDSTFFNVFKVRMVAGNPSTALIHAYTMVLSQSQAKAYFGDKNPLGQKVYLNEWLPFTITGVYEDVPENSSIQFNFLASWSTITEGFHEETDRGNFDEPRIYTFVTLHPSVRDISAVNAKLAKIAAGHLPGIRLLHSDASYSLMPLKDIHYSTGLKDELEPGRNKTLLVALLYIAFIVLFSALINFVNLSLAQSFQRASEIVIRKIHGASTANIRMQFVAEVFILGLAASTTGLAWFWLFIKLLSAYLPTEFSSLGTLVSIHSILYLALLIPLIMLAAIYPVQLIARQKPAFILKKQLTTGRDKNLLKNILVGFQLFLAILTIGCTITVYRQIDYMRHYDVGLSTQQTISLQGPASTNADSLRYRKFAAFKKDVLTNSKFIAATATTNIPGQELYVHDETIKLLNVKNTRKQSFGVASIDDGYLQTYSIPLLAGRDLNEKDSNYFCLINQSAARALGFENPLSAVHARLVSEKNGKVTVAGVIQDFHQESLQKKIEPIVCYFAHPVLFGYYSFRTGSQNRSGILAVLKQKWLAHYPDDPFIYYFTDVFFANQYKNEELFEKFMGLFCIISVLVASMGLIGLTALSAIKRTKEIGIRKVVGASVFRILLLLSQDYLRFVVIAYAIALPLLYIFIHAWMQNFSYRITIGVWTFIFPWLLVLFITWIVVGLQSLKAAVACPVKSLRTE